MSTKMIVLVSDREDPKHGEVTVLDDARRAERLVETLLEAGFERERIRVFTGAEMDVQISQRPVVALVGEETEASLAPEGLPSEEEREPEEAPDGTAKEEEQAEVTAYVQNGVRFSSLFRSS